MNREDTTSSTETSQHHRHAKLVLVIASLLLVALIILISYFLTFESSDKSDTNISTKTQQQTTELPEIVKAEPLSKNWLEIDNNDYKIKIPDGWNVVNQDKSVILVSCDSTPQCYDLQEGTTATVEDTTGGRDGLQGLSYSLDKNLVDISEISSNYSLEKGLIDGYSLFVKDINTEQEEEIIPIEIPAGTKEYIAIKKIDGAGLSYFYYSVTPSQMDPTQLVEEMISTLEIKQ
jgi:hypothetical protein